jgi:hypothetical protein
VTAPLMFNPSLAAYEQYRKDAGADPDVQKAVAFTRERAASSAMSRRLLAVATKSGSHFAKGVCIDGVQNSVYRKYDEDRNGSRSSNRAHGQGSVTIRREHPCAVSRLLTGPFLCPEFGPRLVRFSSASL